MSDITIFAGPMFSEKSDELIKVMFAYDLAGHNVAAFQPEANVREDVLRSRSGRSYPAKRISTLKEVNVDNSDVIGVDEIFMLPEDDSDIFLKWRQMGKLVYGVTLDTLANGNIPPIYLKLQQYGARIVQMTAVCVFDHGDEDCGGGERKIATHTIIRDGNTGQRLYDLPDVVPEGVVPNYQYSASCFTGFLDEEMESKLRVGPQ